jgi:nitrous oxidase accessory protein
MRIALSCFAFILISAAAYGRLIEVGKGKQHATLKGAISIAVDSDTILVHGGTYKEGNIVIQKAVTILGKNWPVFDGENKFEIFTLHGRNITVSGIHFRDTGVGSINDLAAIKVLESREIRIINNRFDNAFFGIYFANTVASTIEGNTLTATGTFEQQVGNGIHMWKCDNIRIIDNKVKGHRDGIYFEFVTNSLITGNHSAQNLRYGLHFMFSHDDEYRDNVFLANGAGVAVMYTKGVKMTGNIFQDNVGPASYGLLLKDIRDSFVRNNHFLGNTIGIYMEGSSRIRFTENDFSTNGFAIKLQASCDDNTFSRNNFRGNTFDIATNGSLVLNAINENYWDRYEGYDMNEDHVGDVPYRPVSMYAMVVERMPAAVLLWRSFLVFLLDRAEKAIPVITPENLKDDKPQMRPYDRD